MSTRYFSKVGPRTPILLPNGDAWKFETLDGKIGFSATEDPVKFAAAEKCIAEGRGGLSVIDKAHYESEFVKKKASSPLYVHPTELPGIRPGAAGDTVGARHTVQASPAAEVKPAQPVKVDTGKPLPHPRIGKRHPLKD